MTGHLSPALESLLHPQERFDSLYQVYMRRAGHNACDLAYANAYDGPDLIVTRAIEDALHSHRSLQLQYTPYGGDTITRRLIADKLTQIYEECFHWRDVILTPGAMAALNVVFRALKTDGPDELIVLTPCWMDYPLYLVQMGFKPVLVPLKRVTFRFDFALIENAITPATRAIIFSQPANPTGIVYADEELAQLAKLLQQKSAGRPEPLLVISDECHRDVVYAPNAFVSPLRHYDATIIVYSFGKSLLMQGQRIGFIGISPRTRGRECLQRLLERNCRMMGFCTPTALMQVAIRKLLAHGPDLTRLAARRDRITSALRSFGYSVISPQATFFIYVRSPNPDDFAFTEKLASKGVFVLPGSLFHDPGYVRISVTASDKMVDRALPVFRSLLTQ